MELSIPVPVPELPNVIPADPCLIITPLLFRIVGMDFLNSLPIPEFAISQTGIKTGIGLL